MILSRTEEGDAIQVKDIRALETDILRKYYKSNKYETFVRQLNKYDFKRLKPESVGSFSALPGVRDFFKHEFFRRGQRELLAEIKKKKAPAGGNKKFDCRQEVQVLQGKLVSLEEEHLQMLTSIRTIQGAIEEQFQTDPFSPQKRAERAGDLERIENRLRSVENYVFNLLNQRQSTHHSSSQFDLHHGDMRSNLDNTQPGQSALPTLAADNEFEQPTEGEIEAPLYPQQHSGPLIRERTEDSWIRGIDFNDMEED